jgi:hypothetical protein
MFDIISQVMIAVFGVASIYLSQQPRVELQKYASIFGILSQPFWFYTSFVSANWGIFILCFFYLYAWSVGFYHHWVKGVSLSEYRDRLYARFGGHAPIGAVVDVVFLGGCMDTEVSRSKGEVIHRENLDNTAVMRRGVRGYYNYCVKLDDGRVIQGHTGDMSYCKEIKRWELRK